MYEKVLLALDGSGLSASAVPHVLAVAQPLGAEVMVLQVVDAVGHIVSQYTPAGFEPGPGRVVAEIAERAVDAQRTAAEQHLNEVNRQLEAEGVANVSIEIVEGSPGDMICDRAEELGCDLVVIRTAGGRRRDRQEYSVSTPQPLAGLPTRARRRQAGYRGRAFLMSEKLAPGTNRQIVRPGLSTVHVWPGAARASAGRTAQSSVTSESRMPVVPRKLALGVAVVAALVAGCGGMGGMRGMMRAPEQIEGSLAEMSVSEFFSANCATCHGGRRQGGIGPPLIPSRLIQSDEFYFEAIANGQPGTAMPAWSRRGLSSADIDTLIAFLRTEP